MSYDFALGRLCTHEVFLESAELDPFVHDTVRFQRPPSSSFIRVFVDGLEVPSHGVVSRASITLMEREPFRLKHSQNDLLYLSVGSDAPRFIPLMTGPSVSAKDLATYLRRQVPGMSFTADAGRVSVSLDPSVASRFCFHDPRWTDRIGSLQSTSRVVGGYSELGIVPGRVVSGVKTFPGWRVQSDPNSFVDEKILVFDRPLLNSRPSIQLCYFTDAGNCRRCFGSRLEFDYGVVDAEYEVVRDSDLLLQEFDKYLFTRRGSHWKWPWLGTPIADRVGGKALTVAGSSTAFVSMDVTQAFRTYQDIKKQQDAMVFQMVTDAEFPLSMEDLSVQFSPVDPTIVVFQSTIVSRSQKPIELKRIVGNPNPAFFPGSAEPFLKRA